MVLESIRLRDFRCFGALVCRLEPVSVFTGGNAQGKTSVLEGVCMLLRLQSPRTTNLRELVRFGAAGCGVAGTAGGREMMVTSDGSGKVLRLGGEIVRRSPDYLAESGLVVWMGSGDRELVTGTGEVRRRYLDFAGSQLFGDYRPALRAYEKALRSRNLLLKRDATPPWREVEAWTAVLAEHGELLSRRRRELIGLLLPEVVQAYGAISGGGEVPGLVWEPGGPEEGLADRLRELRSEEFARRVTAAGPHRDDFRILIDGNPAAKFGSEGQQRTMAVALKLAQAGLLRRLTGRPPVLLIDDVFGELDPSRRRALMRSLPEDSQKLITTTQLDWLEGRWPGGTVYRVAGGRVEAA